MGIRLALGANFCFLCSWLEGLNPQDHDQRKQRITPNVKLIPLEKNVTAIIPDRCRGQQLEALSREERHDLNARLRQNLLYNFSLAVAMLIDFAYGLNMDTERIETHQYP